MNRSSCGGLLVAVLVTFVGVPGVWAQGNTTQAEGWQGPRPTPQQRTPLPTPQQPAPSGKQVLEIPSRPQQPVPALPTPQAVIPPRPQPAQGQPTQLITVTVTDPQGHYIPGLRPEDFLLYEEDLPQKITYFNTGQDEPVSLGLLVDMSSSMLSKIARARQGCVLSRKPPFLVCPGSSGGQASRTQANGSTHSWPLLSRGRCRVNLHLVRNLSKQTCQDVKRLLFAPRYTRGLDTS